MAEAVLPQNSETPASAHSVPRPRMRPMRVGPGLKIIGIACLVVLMGIPVSLIGFVTSDRMSDARQAVLVTADQWGGISQVLQGPWLIVPHKVTRTKTIATLRADCTGRKDECSDQREESYEVKNYLVFAPKSLQGASELTGRELKRGIHKVPVYDAATTITGGFAPLDPAGMSDVDVSRILWDEAFVSMTVSDQRTFMDRAELEWNGTTLAFEPGVVPSGGRVANDHPGIHVRVPDLSAKAAPNFVISLKQKGGLTFALAPRGQDISWTMTSNWPDPNFAGRFLPVERSVDENGFSASWSLPNVARAPQIVQSFAKLEDAFGEVQVYSQFADHLGASGQGPDVVVKLHQPIDQYSLTNRALKYALLFIGLVFLTLFLLETAAGGKPIHPVQYLFVGLANAVFYLLLLAFSENIGFAPAYLVAALATCILIGLYVMAVLATVRRAMVVVATLIVIYGLLWVILNLEDFALMVGSIVVFAALAIAMYATRKIDWYGKPKAFAGGAEPQAQPV